MPQTCHVCHSLHVYVNVYNSYELNAINIVTRSTGIHTFHITDICPWTNMGTTLYIYVSLHFYWSLHIGPTILHISMKNSINCNIYFPYYHKLCASNKYAINISYAQMPQMQLWGTRGILWFLHNFFFMFFINLWNKVFSKDKKKIQRVCREYFIPILTVFKGLYFSRWWAIIGYVQHVHRHIPGILKDSYIIPAL